MTAAHKRQVQVIGLAWCTLCSVGATIGATLAWIVYNGRKA